MQQDRTAPACSPHGHPERTEPVILRSSGCDALRQSPNFDGNRWSRTGTGVLENISQRLERSPAHVIGISIPVRRCPGHIGSGSAIDEASRGEAPHNLRAEMSRQTGPQVLHCFLNSSGDLEPISPAKTEEMECRFSSHCAGLFSPVARPNGGSDSRRTRCLEARAIRGGTSHSAGFAEFRIFYGNSLSAPVFVRRVSVFIKI